MFGTLRYDVSSNASSSSSRRNKAVVQLQPAQATAGFFPPHAACDTCRAKKLRCSGQKPTCNRCQATKLQCQYTQTTDKRKKKPSARPTGPTAQNRRQSTTSGETPTGNKGHDSNDGQVEASESSASGINDSIMDLWDVTLSGEVHASNRTPLILEDAAFDGNKCQDAAHEETLVPVCDALTSDLFHSAPNGIHHQEMMPGNIWDPLGSPSLDLTDWDDVMSCSPGPTQIQSQGHSQQRMSITRSCSAGLVSSPAFPTLLHRHEVNVGEQIADKNRHEGTFTTPTLLPLNTYLSPASTASIAGGEVPANCSKSQQLSSLRDHFNSKNAATGAQCSCVQNAAALLDEISARVFKGSSSISFDIALSFLKSTLSKCSATFECTRCICRSDFCMLLAVVIERLVTLGEDVALVHVLGTQSHLPDKEARTGWDQGTSSDTRLRRFGSYDLSSMEHGVIARGLLNLHIQSCQVLVEKMAHVARLSNREAQVHLLVTTEQQINHLLALLGERTDKTPT